MKNVILLSHRENTRMVEQEFRYKFVYEVLEAVGLPISEIWNETILTPVQKLTLVDLLNKNNIEIIEEDDGNLEIFFKKEQIAKWNKPTYVLKRDFSSISRDKQFYLEMTVSYWSQYHRETNDK